VSLYIPNALHHWNNILILKLVVLIKGYQWTNKYSTKLTAEDKRYQHQILLGNTFTFFSSLHFTWVAVQIQKQKQCRLKLNLDNSLPGSSHHRKDGSNNIDKFRNAKLACMFVTFFYSIPDTSVDIQKHIHCRVMSKYIQQYTVLQIYCKQNIITRGVME